MSSAMESIIQSRMSRTDLDTTKCYTKIQHGKEEYVGRFIRCYRMGSGDGQTFHWEFDNAGKIIRIADEAYGNIDGQGLVGFRVAS